MNDSITKHKPNYSPGYKICFILFCALLTGFLWRLRGDHGWGGMAGMVAVGTGLILSVIAFMPYNKKANFEILTVAVFMTAITNSGWGTLNSQITGVLVSSTDAPSVAVSPFSGIAAMFLLGFAWAPFLAMFIGYYLSEKKPRFFHFLIAAALYFAVEYAAKASLSHFAVKLVCPDSVHAFAEALGAAGIKGYPFTVYLAHFNNISWAKKIAFGRNYFQLVETFSRFLAAWAMIVYTALGMKDRFAAKVQTAVCISIGVSITLADLFIFFADGGFRNTLTIIPEWLSGWANWEYWTGFFVGLFIAVIVVKITSDRKTSEVSVPTSLLPKNKALFFLRNYIMFCFPVISAVVLPLAKRLTSENDVLFRSVTFSDEDILCIPLALSAGILLIYPTIKITKRELSVGGSILFDYAEKWLIGSFVLFGLLYFFTGNAYLLNGNITDISITTYISAIGIIVLYFILHKKKTELYFH